MKLGIFFNLRDRGRERERYIHAHTHTQAWGLKARSGNFKTGLPCGCQELNCLRHYHCIPGLALAEHWIQELEIGTEPTDSDTRCGYFNGQLKQ